MKVSRCGVGLTYEGINKTVEEDIIFNDGLTAMVVFEWKHSENAHSPSIGFEAHLRDLQETNGTPPYFLSIALDTDNMPPSTKAYILKKYFGCD